MPFLSSSSSCSFSSSPRDTGLVFLYIFILSMCCMLPYLTSLCSACLSSSLFSSWARLLQNFPRLSIKASVCVCVCVCVCKRESSCKMCPSHNHSPTHPHAHSTTHTSQPFLNYHRIIYTMPLLSLPLPLFSVLVFYVIMLSSLSILSNLCLSLCESPLKIGFCVLLLSFFSSSSSCLT